MSTSAAVAGLAFHHQVISNAAVTSGAGNTWVDFGEYLSAGDFTPDVSGSRLAKVDFVLHDRLDVLHMAVEHRHGNHRNQSSDGGDADAKESNTAHGLGFALSVLLVHG